MLPKLLKSPQMETDSLRAGFGRSGLALGFVVMATSLLAAGERSLPGEGPLQVAFTPVGADALPPGLSGGAFPGFRNGAATPLDHVPSHDGTERPRSRDPNDDLTSLQKQEPAPQEPALRVEKSLTEAEKAQLKLTQRYRDPVVERFVHSVTANQAIQFYRETGRLIDTRHVQPASYEARVKQAVANLSHAVENPAFLQANRLSPSESQVRTFQQSVEWLIANRPVRTSGDALNMLYWTIDLAGRHVGMRPTTVALEFVQGAAESLDEYSAFVPEDNFHRPSVSLDDHVVGIGVEIKPHDEGVIVVRPLRGGPAEAAGLRPDDIIVSIDGRRLAGQSLEYAVDLITGPAGSRLSLGIERDGFRTAPVMLTRRRVTVHSVSEVRMMDEEAKVGYIKLDRFSSSSEEEMDEALWSLHRQGMQSLVLDLRGNPGGLLTTAISLSNKFLPCGTIVSTRGRTGSDQSAERASFDRTWAVPLVVLIDEESASASEIFAAAIQENRRGVVVGRQSFGKGTVQTHFPLSSVSGNFKLTTAHFFSPSGRTIAEAGVEPDVLVNGPRSASAEVSSIDRDIEAALTVAVSHRPRQLAVAQGGCHNRASRDLQLQS